MDSHSLDVSAVDFEKQVLDASRHKPVVVDFWAPWCGPCRALTPVLEKLAAEFRGEFLVAKVNTDENPELAARFGVRGIPNVKAFRDGTVVAEFSGAIPESALRAFLQKLIPSSGEKLRQAARAALGEGDFDTAESRLREAIQTEPGLHEARLDLAEQLIARHAWTEAERLLSEIPERERDERADSLARRIEHWKKAQSLPDASELVARVQQSPEDLSLRLQLAERLLTDGALEPALEQLIEVVRADRGELREAARSMMLEIFALADKDQDLVSRYRRLLATALH